MKLYNNDYIIKQSFMDLHLHVGHWFYAHAVFFLVEVGAETEGVFLYNIRGDGEGEEEFVHFEI